MTRPGPLQLSPLPRVQLQRPLQQRLALPDQLPQKAQPKRKHLPSPRRQLRLKLRLNLSLQGELQGVRRHLLKARQKHLQRPLQRFKRRPKQKRQQRTRLQQRLALPDQPQKAQPKRKLRQNLSLQFQGELQGVLRRHLLQARQKHQPRPLQRHRSSHSHLHPQRVSKRPQQRFKRRRPKQRRQPRPRLPPRPKLVYWLERLQRLSMELLLQKHLEELKGKLALELQPQRPRNRKSPLLPKRRPRAPRRLLPLLHSSRPRRLQP